MIDKGDVIEVADSLGISLTEDEINLIVNDYPAYVAGSNENWTYIVEDMIYEIENQR
jgi:Ca2+-binding EF-hand superfamily protein